MSEKRDGAAPPPARKQWDKDEWAQKAKDKDAESAQRAKEAEAAMAKGQKPKFKDRDDIPKPTENMKQRTEDIGLNKDVNKTMLVQTSTTGRGPRGPGYYCELCNRTLKDSLSYLDHVNGRMHLMRIGQTTTVARSTVAQVREKIRMLREQTASKVTAKNFDFNSRLGEVRSAQQSAREQRKEEKKRKRQERREEEELSKLGIVGKKAGNGDGSKDDRAVERAVAKAQKEADDMSAMMGFGGFGGGKKR